MAERPQKGPNGVIVSLIVSAARSLSFESLRASFCSHGGAVLSAGAGVANANANGCPGWLKGGSVSPVASHGAGTLHMKGAALRHLPSLRSRVHSVYA